LKPPVNSTQNQLPLKDFFTAVESKIGAFSPVTEELFLVAGLPQIELLENSLSEEAITLLGIITELPSRYSEFF
jgi:hypothetical protein